MEYMVVITDMRDDENTDDPEEVSIPDDVLDEIGEDDAEEEDLEDETPVVAAPAIEDEPEEAEALLTTEEEPEDVDFDAHDDIDPI